MRTFGTRLVQTISDLTVGTIIVLVHVAMADAEKSRPAHNTGMRARRARGSGSMTPPRGVSHRVLRDASE
jgi:hypothetical protein